MSAPDHAIPLSEENPNWKKEKGFPDFKCPCGYEGRGHELLCVDESETLWCPVCRTSGWVWK